MFRFIGAFNRESVLPTLEWKEGIREEETLLVLCSRLIIPVNNELTQSAMIPASSQRHCITFAQGHPVMPLAMKRKKKFERVTM
jgi:hypothetical protein